MKLITLVLSGEDSSVSAILNRVVEEIHSGKCALIEMKVEEAEA